MQSNQGHFAFGLFSLTLAVVISCGGSSDGDDTGSTAGSSGTTSGAGGKGAAGSASPGGTGNNTSGTGSGTAGTASGGSSSAGGSFGGGGFPVGGFGNFPGFGGEGPSIPGFGGDGSIDVNSCPADVDSGTACTYVEGGITENVCQGAGVYCACMAANTYQCLTVP
jgi:hypothetical protein